MSRAEPCEFCLIKDIQNAKRSAWSAKLRERTRVAEERAALWKYKLDEADAYHSLLIREIRNLEKQLGGRLK